jgi:hypothetical protein
MKRVFALLPALLMTVAQPVFAAYYQWTDSNGVVHFTDNRSRIPKQYRKKAKKLNMSEAPPSKGGETPPVQVVPMGSQGASQSSGEQPQQKPVEQPARPPQAGPGGHSEQWWRQQFADLKRELGKVQESLTKNRAKLAEAQRKRAIYTRIRDREAVNAAQALVSADESTLNDVMGRMEALSREAAAAGVPPEWRQ